MTGSSDIDGSSDVPSVPHQRRMVLLVLALVVVHCALAWTARAPAISWGEDDAQYALLGRSVAHGDYREPWNVDAPIAVRYPPGFPALLAATNLAFGEHLDVQLVVLLVCSVASLLLLFDIARRRLGDTTAVVVTGLSAINPSFLWEAGNLASEAPFRLLVALTLWAGSAESPRTRDLVIAGGAAVLAALVRSAGIAVIAALCAYWLLQRRWKAVGFLLLASIPVAGWLEWTRLAPDTVHRGVYVHAIAVSVKTSAQSTTGVAMRTLQRLLAYARQEIPTSLGFVAVKGTLVDNLVWVGVLLVLFPAGLLVLWRRWKLAAAVLLFYGAMLVLWPWTSWRFVSPMNGLLLILIVSGATLLAQRWGQGAQRAALAAVAVPFLAGAFKFAAPTLQARLSCPRAAAKESPQCFAEAERGFYQLARHVRETTPPNAVFFTPKEAAFYYHARRQSVREIPILDVLPDSLGRILREAGVSYAVVTPIGVAARTHNRLIARACREFELERAFEGGAVLLRLRSDGPAASEDASDACRLLAPWSELAR